MEGRGSKGRWQWRRATTGCIGIGRERGMDHCEQSSHRDPLFFSNRGLGEAISRKAEEKLVLSVCITPFCHVLLSPTHPIQHSLLLPSSISVGNSGFRISGIDSLVKYNATCTLSPKKIQVGNFFIEWLDRVKYCNGDK